MKYRTRSGLSALAAAGLLLLAGCGGDDAPATDDAQPAEDSQTAETAAAADVEFAQQMIPHHVQAVEMARMVPDDGVSPELIELAEAVEAEQQPEIEQLSAMLERWGEDVPATGGDGHGGHGGDDGHGGHGDDMHGMMSEEDMEELGGASADHFERMWLTMMIEHHEGAIVMARDQLENGTDEEALALAEAIVEAQEAEIAHMEQMLDALDAG